MKKIRNLIIGFLAVFVLTACTETDKKNDATQDDEKISAQSFNDLKKAHPTPKFDRSQLRR